MEFDSCPAPASYFVKQGSPAGFQSFSRGCKEFPDIEKIRLDFASQQRSVPFAALALRLQFLLPRRLPLIFKQAKGEHMLRTIALVMAGFGIMEMLCLAYIVFGLSFCAA
jgi:hypothetical protein